VVPPAPKTPRRRKRARGAGAAVLALIALSGGRAAAKPAAKLVAGIADYVADRNAVLVENLPIDPPKGTYVLVSSAGPIGALALDRTSPHQGGCPYDAELHLIDPPASPPTGVLAVVGPIDPSSPTPPRLIDRGPPLAIDLDGDGKPDLRVETSTVHGRFVHGIAGVSSTTTLSARTGTRWTKTATCRWKTTDTID
jgi:hypothetical protein